MLNKKSLMIQTMLMPAVGVFGFAGSAEAQCAITDCEALGYTEAYNSSGNCLKCPFGEAYSCEKGYICPDGYTQECTGENMTGGVGEACNGKYAECACKEGYNMVDGECSLAWGTCSGLAANCALGDILFSDGTCSANKVSGKTPIAVVVYKSGSCGQAMALKSLGDYKWSTEYVDISTLPNLSSSQASQDFASCENSAKIRAQGNSSTYPAVWAAYNYTTTGTKVGDWCLPAAGIFTSIYNNQSTINTGFSRANGTQFTNSTYAWSSSEYDSDYAWSSDFSYEYGLSYYGGKIYSNEVRPVLEGSIASEGAEFCTNSYQYTCDGANETGGSSTSCGGKYQSCNCASGYEWKDGSCVAQCDSSYKYTCTGSYERPSGSSCGGKYTACSCYSPYGWDSSSGSCVCAAQLTCTGEHETGGSGISCNGKYSWCSCESGYEWVGCEISGEWKGCMPEITGEYICGD